MCVRFAPAETEPLKAGAKFSVEVPVFVIVASAVTIFNSVPLLEVILK